MSNPVEPPRRLYLVEHCADSFERLKDWSGTVDVIITDPPYPEHVQNNLCSGSLVGTKNVPKYQLGFDPLSKEKHIWLYDAIRIAKRWVISFCAVEDFGRFQDLMGKIYVRGGIWYKPNAMGQLTRDRPATAYEGIAFLHNMKLKKRWNGRGSFGIWRCNGTRGKKDRNPNEKPLELCLKLIALCSERGETVLDPFCGSGAIGEACKILDRSYIGWDNDPVWVEKASNRISACTRTMTDEEALKLCLMKVPEPPKAKRKAKQLECPSS